MAQMTTGLDITLETVTPLFLAGADPRGEPELRPASFRGALRFWLRALLGGALGDDNMEALRKAEAAVFGSTEAASPVVVRLAAQKLSVSREDLLPHHAPGERIVKAKGYEPGGSLVLHLSVRPAASDGATVLPLTLSSLWLLVHLGGVGRRVRRGMGNLQIIPPDPRPEGLPEPVCRQVRTLDDLKSCLEKGLYEIHNRAVDWLRTRKAQLRPWSRLPTYSVLSPPYASLVLVDGGWTSWKQLLIDAGLEMRGYKHETFGAGRPRRGSPLLVHVYRLADERYVVGLLVLKAELYRGKSPDWSKVNSFVADFRTKPGRTSVNVTMPGLSTKGGAR